MCPRPMPTCRRWPNGPGFRRRRRCAKGWAASSLGIGITSRCESGRGALLGHHAAVSREATTMTTIAVIGLGYVGLPLAVEFGKKFTTLGFDLSADKVEAYRRHVDPTGEVSSDDLKASVHLRCSTDPKIIGEADFII